MDLIGQSHQIDTRRKAERPCVDPDAPFDIVGRLRFKIEARNGERKWASRADALVRIAEPKGASRAREYCKNRIKTVLDSEMSCPLPFVLIERRDLRIVGIEPGIRIIDRAVNVARVYRVVLNAAADRNVGVRSHCRCVHSVKGQGRLLDVVAMNWYQAGCGGSIGVVLRAVEIKPRQQPIGNAE